MKKTFSALFMVFAVAFSVMLLSGTTSKALTTWNANVEQTGAGENKVDLKWDAYLGADFYKIMFSYDNNTWTEMDYSTSPSDTVYQLTSGATYYAKIVAYSGSYYLSNTPLAESETLDVVTSPAKAEDFKQTNATKDSITMSWTAVPGASGYLVCRYNSYGNYTPLGTTKTNSYTAKGLSASSEIKYFILPVRTNSKGQEARSTYINAVTMRTAPSKVSYVQMTNYYSSLGSCSYGWNTVNNADGYQFQLLDYKGKKLLSKETTWHSMSVDPFKKGVFTKARCRAYITVNNKKIYGAWSGYDYNAASGNIKVYRSGNRKKITLKWSKIKGASGYKIYVSTKSNSGYKKVKTLGAKKTKYSFTKVGKKKLQKYKTYYIRIKYLTKVGKKTVTSRVSGQGSI